MVVGRPSPKVFVDSSVVFTAAVSPTGGGRELVRQGLRGRCSLLVSHLVIEETRRNLAMKVPGQLDAFEALIELRAFNIVEDPSEAILLRCAEIVEAKDAPILAAALQAEADYVATYDAKHLLREAEAIRTALDLVVLTPGDLLASLRPDPRGP